MESAVDSIDGESSNRSSWTDPRDLGSGRLCCGEGGGGQEWKRMKIGGNASNVIVLRVEVGRCGDGGGIGIGRLGQDKIISQCPGFPRP